MSSYERVNWKNSPSTETPINDVNLNIMDKGIEDAHKKIENIANILYPVGSIYMSVNPTNPSELFGGTWEAWGSGRVPVGVDTTQEEFETVQKAGGEKTHTLTIGEMPAHNHGLNFANNIGPYASPASGDGGASWGNSTNTVSNTGGNKPHNNLQPYITCYMWLRTE